MAAQPARLELFERIESVVRAELRAIRQDDHDREASGASRRGQGHSYVVDDDGQCHVRGNLSERSAYGIMRPDVTACRKALRAIGITLSAAETESAMRQMQALDDGTIQAHRGAGSSTDIRKAKAAEKMRKRRAKAREAGLCGICAMRPAEAGKASCSLCIFYGSERSKKSHARRAASNR